MIEIDINNPELLDILNRAENFLDPGVFKFWRESKRELIENPEYWISDEYLYELMKVGSTHAGYPEKVVGYNLSLRAPENLRNTNDPDVHNKIKIISDVIYSIQNHLGLRVNALAQVYTPEGFISWHNNANCPGYNVLFTWSETGDGWFKYYDTKKKEIVTLHDKKGWQCRAGYYGTYDFPEKVFYHSAYTSCWRMTIAFVLDDSEMSTGLHEDVIEEITSSF